MANVINEIKNWNLFTEKFGSEYEMHDAVIKQFDLNGDNLTIVVNTLYEMEDGKVYDIALRFSHLIRFDYDTEIGNDYIYGIEVVKDKFYNNLFKFTFDSVCLTIECFEIELMSITESEPFQRGMIWLNEPNQTSDSGKMMWRT
ncbi:MAG: hypothetical protein IKQ32_02160 [Prevotella sp.]|nr:hypothetical protein [Prevotella sp.]